MHSKPNVSPKLGSRRASGTRGTWWGGCSGAGRWVSGHCPGGGGALPPPDGFPPIPLPGEQRPGGQCPHTVVGTRVGSHHGAGRHRASTSHPESCLAPCRQHSSSGHLLRVRQPDPLPAAEGSWGGEAPAGGVGRGPRTPEARPGHHPPSGCDRRASGGWVTRGHHLFSKGTV